MSATSTLSEVKNSALAPREAGMPAVTMGFGSLQSFELMQCAAKLLSSSTLVPVAYRAWDEKKGDNPNALANCVVSLNMAQRMGADPLMVMQNLYIVEGRPSWSSQWIIAAINGCGRFSPLRFDMKDLGPKEVEYEVTKWVNRERVTNRHKATVQNLECIAWAIEKETGARIDSPRVSVEMAVKEGWYGKSGSKWQTMPEVMLRYRTASFFGKLYAPELLMGLQSVEEAQDVIDVQPDGSYTVTRTVDELRGASVPRAEVVDPTPNAAADQAGPEVGAQPAGDDAGQSTAQTQAQQEIPGAGGLTFKAVQEELIDAKTIEDLDYARSLIKQVINEQDKTELHQLASQRMRELTPQDTPAQTTTTTRRTRTPVGAE